MDVVIYVVDALRADHVSSLGHARQTTANIDELAADGITYAQCFTPATWTKPTGASILTGTYPPAHGARTREDLFDTSLPRLPEALSKRGFETVGISSMGNVSSTVGFDSGFDSFLDVYKRDDILERRRTASVAEEGLVHERSSEVALPNAEDLNRFILPRIGEQEDTFLFCWAIDAHMPYGLHRDEHVFTNEYAGPVDGSYESLPETPSLEDIEQLQLLYDNEIHFVDRNVGEIIAKLKSEGRYDESLVVIAGDHGTGFDEHGHLFHASAPFEELVHVPLILKPPENDHDGRVVESPVSLVDIFPTVLRILGVEAPDTVQGSPMPPFGGDEGKPVFSETQLRPYKPLYRAVRTKKWKYIRIDENPLGPTDLFDYIRSNDKVRHLIANPRHYLNYPPSNENGEHVYNLHDDPNEAVNSVDADDDVTNELRSELDAWVSRCRTLQRDWGSEEREAVDAATEEQLRHLGYTE